MVWAQIRTDRLSVLIWIQTFDTLIVFLKELFEKVNFEKSKQTTTKACQTADPGVASLIPARYHTFVEFDHELISMVILLPSADSFKKGCCQLQAKVCARNTG